MFSTSSSLSFCRSSSPLSFVAIVVRRQCRSSLVVAVVGRRRLFVFLEVAVVSRRRRHFSSSLSFLVVVVVVVTVPISIVGRCRMLLSSLFQFCRRRRRGIGFLTIYIL